MSDAWLGRAAAGETTPEVLYHLYRTSKANLGRDQRRLGLPRNALAGRFQTGLYLDYGLSTLTEVGLAYAAGLIQGADYGEAEKVLNELDISRKAMPGGDAESTEICAYVPHLPTPRRLPTSTWPRGRT
ncbi:AAA+ family ATPase [Mycobacteroides abscessus subsp. massiliense]|nr:AAA+ family ATPase [Mycobacteroides abscessus subsp. massiliense]